MNCSCNPCGCNNSPRLNGTELTILSGTQPNAHYRKNDNDIPSKKHNEYLAIGSCIALAVIFGFVTMSDKRTSKQ